MAFDLDMISIGCVAPMDPVMKFSTSCLVELAKTKTDTRFKRGTKLLRAMPDASFYSTFERCLQL